MSSLKQTFVSGIIYTAIAKYAGIFVSLVVTAILARLIGSEEFGIVAVATVFINFFSILTTVGITPAIIQNKELTREDINNINSFAILLSVTITIIYICIVPIIAHFYDEKEQLKTILFLLSFNVLFSIASIVPNALIYKEKLFSFLAIRTFSIQCVLGIISVICAISGLGIYSLVINPIGISLFLLVVSFIKYPIPFLLRFDLKSVKKILYFSSYQALFNLVYLLYRNIDQVFVGKKFGLSTLGYYEKSYRLMMLPLDNISSVISPVLHPLLSEYQSEKSTIWDVNKKMISFLSEFCLLVSVYLFWVSDSIIYILYGENWANSIPIFRILTLSIWAQILQSPTGPILQSLNKVQSLTIGGCWILLFVIVSVFTSWIFNNLDILYIGIVLSFIAGFFIYQSYIAKAVSKPFKEIIKIIMPQFIVAFVLFVISSIINKYVYIENHWIKLCAYSILLLLYTIILTFLGFMPTIRNIIINKIFVKK